MDLSRLRNSETAGVNGYCIPASYELAGKCLDIAYDGGEKTRLDFAAAPGREVSLGDGKTYFYNCVKTGGDSFFVSFTEESRCTFLAIDTGSGLVTKIHTDASAEISPSFGAISPHATGGQYVATDAFTGNAFQWSFGPDAVFIVTAVYGADAVTISYPLAGDGAPVTTVSGFTAVRLAEGVYLQSAAVTVNGRLFSVALTTDFNNMLCAGGVFGVNGGNATHVIIGGYGCDAKEQRRG